MKVKVIKPIYKKERFLKCFVQPFYMITKCDQNSLIKFINSLDEIDYINCILTLFDDNENILEIICLDNDKIQETIIFFKSILNNELLKDKIVFHVDVVPKKPLFNIRI